MYERETSSQRCPACYRSFTVLADEYGTHPCPYCGYEPWEPDENECGCECPECACQTEDDEEEDEE